MAFQADNVKTLTSYVPQALQFLDFTPDKSVYRFAPDQRVLFSHLHVFVSVVDRDLGDQSAICEAI
jgi:hypothetical protein